MNSAKAKLQLPAGIYDELWRHLLRKLGGDEEAAFVFVERDTTDSTLFRYVEWSSGATRRLRRAIAIPF